MGKFTFKLNEKGVPALVGMLILLTFTGLLVITGLGFLGLLK